MRSLHRPRVVLIPILLLALAAAVVGQPIEPATSTEQTTAAEPAEQTNPAEQVPAAEQATKFEPPPKLLQPATLLLCDADPAKDGNCLGRIALVAIALLIAFLTVVEVWQIQPPTTSLSARGQEGRAAPPNEEKASASAATEPAPARKPRSLLPASSLFSSNFSLTVLSGLGGLAAISVAGDFWGLDENTAQAYFVVFFIGFFLSGLVLSAVVRGLGEAVRSRFILRRFAPAWVSRPKDLSLLSLFGRWLGYWLRYALSWLGSFRATIVVFTDVLFNVLQGKAQVQTSLLSETITNHHEALLEAAERVRGEVHEAVIRALLAAHALPEDLPHEERVRVGISLLSADESEVYYIAGERGSAARSFGRYSVAWVAAFAGVARWVKTGATWASYKEAVLYENETGGIPGPRAPLLVHQYYQLRGDEDYKAFIVLPMPWCRRGTDAGHRRGAIHISFRKEDYLKALWTGLECEGGNGQGKIPAYKAWHQLLQVKEPTGGGLALEPTASELGSVLFLALESLGEALSHFNDEVYDVYIQARRHATALAA